MENESATVTANAEEYMEAIYRLTKSGQKITAADLARYMKISTASATGMLKRLHERGLANYEPHRDIQLTPKGKDIAVGLIRRHRLSERFLTDILGISWEKVHDQACKLEHIITGEVEEKLSTLLGNPTTCPHGQPLDADAADTSVLLSNLPQNENAVIVKVDDERPEFLQYLATLGLIPGVSIKVTARAPFNGPLMVQVGSANYALGQEVAERISVGKEQ